MSYTGETLHWREGDLAAKALVLSGGEVYKWKTTLFGVLDKYGNKY